jgi:Helix-turn-helix domain
VARRSKNPWTADAVRALGLSTNIETAAQIFGLSRTVAYDLLRRGEFPVPTFKVGRRIVVPTAPILRLFGVDVADDAISDEPHEPPTLRVLSLKDG